MASRPEDDYVNPNNVLESYDSAFRRRDQTAPNTGIEAQTATLANPCPDGFARVAEGGNLVGQGYPVNKNSQIFGKISFFNLSKSCAETTKPSRI